MYFFAESEWILIYPVYMIFVRTILSQCCFRGRPSPTIPGLSTSSAILSSLHKKLSIPIPLTLSHYCTRCAFYPRPIPIPPSIIWNNLKGPAPEAIPNRVLLPHLYHGPALVPGRCPCPSQHIRPPRCADRRRHQQYYMYSYVVRTCTGKGIPRNP